MREHQPSHTLPNTPHVFDTLFSILGVDNTQTILEEPATSQMPNDDRPWILSIDDDEFVSLALELRLERLGVQVIRAASGSEGFGAANWEAPELILLDYELPKANGEIVLSKLKSTSATKDIPVIVLTGHHDQCLENRMRSLGAADFFTKPFEWQELWDAMNQHLCIRT